MRARILLLAAALSAFEPACRSSTAPSSQATVRVVFQGATARRTDLPPSLQPCMDGVGMTHIHPSWRSFGASPLRAVPPDRYDITLDDAPVNTRLSFRVNDQNFCDQNPTGAVTRNILVNDVRLVQNTTTPGNGDEPGYAFVVAPNGSITQP
jgi:hypothetical protein